MGSHVTEAVRVRIAAARARRARQQVGRAAGGDESPIGGADEQAPL